MSLHRRIAMLSAALLLAGTGFAAAQSGSSGGLEYGRRRNIIRSILIITGRDIVTWGRGVAGRVCPRRRNNGPDCARAFGQSERGRPAIRRGLALE